MPGRTFAADDRMRHLASSALRGDARLGFRHRDADRSDGFARPAARRRGTSVDATVQSRPDRVDFKVNVERAESMATGSYEAVNLSVGGMCLRSAVPEHIGGFVALRFPLGEDELQLYCEVVWCKREPDESTGSGFRIGLRFVVIGQKERRLIQRFVDERLLRSFCATMLGSPAPAPLPTK